MTLVNRISKLVSADFHGLLDQIEDPELLLRQSVREMSEILESEEKEFQFLMQRNGQIERKLENFKKSHAKIQSEIELCLKSDSDEMAKSFVRKKLECEKLIELVAARQSEIISKTNSQRQVIKHRQEQLEAIKKKMEIFLSERESFNESSETNFGENSVLSMKVSNEEVEVHFIREKEKAMGRKS